jgi:hypothetical protein
MGQRPRITAVILLLLAMTLGLSACATPADPLEAAARVVERYSSAQILPGLPIELVSQVLVALDRGDLPSARALFAPGAPAPETALARLAARWPGPIFGQPEASLSIGPYQTRARFADVQPGQIEAIPIAGSCATGSFQARLILQMTTSGWRIFDVQ